MKKNILRSRLAVACFLSHSMVSSFAQSQNLQKNLSVPQIPYSYNLTNIKEAIHLNNFKEPTDLIISSINQNINVINEMYELVLKYNKINNPKTPLKLVVTVPDNYKVPGELNNNEDQKSGDPLIIVNNWKKDIQKKLNLKTNVEPPHLVISAHKQSQNPWMQDLGDVFLFKFNDGKTSRGFLDTNYHGGKLGSEIFSKLANSLALPIINAQNYQIAEAPNDGDRGGNIESTHENQLIVGNTISKSLFTKLHTMTGRAPLMLRTDFLMTGHIDEILAVVPAKNKCGAALLYLDPIKALNIMMNNLMLKQYSINMFIPSIAHFLKESSKEKSNNFKLSDFNLDQKIRSDLKSEEKEKDILFLTFLRSAKIIDDNVQIVLRNSKCLTEAVGLPGELQIPSAYEAGDFSLSLNRNMAPNKSPTNLVVLKDWVILEKSEFAAEVKQAIEKLGLKVNFIQSDTSDYNMGYGSIHCATQVLRKE